MAEEINLHALRKEVDSAFVGFTPNGGSIKPVHVASGAQRCIYGGFNSTMRIKRLALVSDAKGRVPSGSESEAIYASLVEAGSVEDGVSENSVESMRNVMQRLLSADKGVYVVKGLTDDMISFTAGSKYFLTRTSIYEDTGEFIGGLVHAYCPELAGYIKDLLDRAGDPISLLFGPVLENSMQVFEKARHEDLPAFVNMNESVQWFVNGIRDSGRCLLGNLQKHPNPLMQLRLFNFYCVFQLIRYIAMLEAFYCNEPVKAILLDFSGAAPSQSSIARASEIAYTQMYKSVNRFYAWGYARILKEKGFNSTDLLEAETPIYSAKKATSAELGTLWALAKDRARKCEDDDASRLVFGEAIYDMLAQEASSHPVNCLKVLGTAAGVLYPPDKLHPNKRFVLSQDILEMLLRSTVSPEEILDGSEMRHRLWERFGIIIGGNSFELEQLQRSGMLLQIDEDSLERNYSAFAAQLESMDFAEIMADGILQIRLGGVN